VITAISLLFDYEGAAPSGAAAGSPGRKPRETFPKPPLSPGRGDRGEGAAPAGAREKSSGRLPGAHAPGYQLSPLTGLSGREGEGL